MESNLIASTLPDHCSAIYTDPEQKTVIPTLSSNSFRNEGADDADNDRHQKDD